MAAEVVGMAHITVKKGDTQYALVCSNTANLGEAYQAWQEIGQYLVDRIQQDLASRKPVEAAPEAPKEG
jgi:hypothetical protein